MAAAITAGDDGGGGDYGDGDYGGGGDFNNDI